MMEERDLEQIETMMTRVIGQFQGEIRQEIRQVQSEIRLEMRQFKDEVIGKFDRAIGTTEDNLQRKLQLLGEGHQMLAEKLEETRTELRADIANVDQRLTTVTADLSAHRRDTEAHRKGWRVREE